MAYITPPNTISKAPFAATAARRRVPSLPAAAAMPFREVLDSIHDPLDLPCRFLRLAEARMRTWGVTLYLHGNFQRLVDINRANQGHKWFALMPMFHPATFPGGEAFWLEARSTETSETVMTQAARRYNLWDRSLQQALTSLQLFYDDPLRSRSQGEACACGIPSADLLSGVITYSGAGWAHVDWRGRGAAALLPRLSRMLAQRLWDQDYTISLVDPVLIEKGVVRSYGYCRAEPGVHWVNSASQGSLDLALVWMTRAELLQDLARCMALGEAIPA